MSSRGSGASDPLMIAQSQGPHEAEPEGLTVVGVEIAELCQTFCSSGSELIVLVKGGRGLGMLPSSLPGRLARGIFGRGVRTGG